MKLLDTYLQLKKLAPTFSTRDAAALLGLPEKYASTLLSRLFKEKSIVRLARGRWAYSDTVDPLSLPNILTYPMLSYISLYTALYYHGIIEQIPSTVFAISTAKTNLFDTPIATVSIHHIESALFTGYECYDKNNILIATPEKALFDIFYFNPAKSRLFKTLTELSLSKTFNFKKLNEWNKLVKNKSRKTLILNQIEHYKT